VRGEGATAGRRRAGRGRVLRGRRHPRHGQPVADIGWPHYGNDSGGARYSTAAQIDRTNVGQLRLAWTYRTGALGRSAPLDRKAAFEATPILVDGKLFLSTPYNHVIALDPRTGAKLWEYDAALDLSHGYSDVPLGEIVAGAFKQLLVRLFRPALRGSGSPNFGGPVATAGGLVFTAASMDNVLRAFDSETGRELWKYDLPAGGQTTPMTYRLDGRQYLVIAAGGHGKLGTTRGDYVLAFTLP